jgi:hypothetical protein
MLAYVVGAPQALAGAFWDRRRDAARQMPHPRPSPAHALAASRPVPARPVTVAHDGPEPLGCVRWRLQQAAETFDARFFCAGQDPTAAA